MPFYEVEIEKRQTVWVDMWVDDGDDPWTEAQQVVGFGGIYPPTSGEASPEYEIIAVTEKANVS